MYIVKYRKGYTVKKMPFKSLASANSFVKTCIKNNWLILGFTKEEINIEF